MGKNKIKIARLEAEKSRKDTFRQRLRGIMKKAEEFAILCDIRVLLLANSPSEPDRFTIATHNCNLEQVMQLYAAQTPENRYKAKLDAIKKLCNAYGEEHVVNAEELLQHRSLLPEKNEVNEVEQQKSQLAKLKEEISRIQSIMGPLGYLPDLENIESLNTLTEMENCLLDLLKQNNLKRELFQMQWVQSRM